MERYVELASLLAEETTLRPSADLLSELAAAGIPAGPIYSVEQMLEDRQALAREMVIETEHPVFGRLPTIANPVKLSATPWGLRRLAPRLGEHRDEILGELGLSSADVAILRGEGVIG